MYELHSLDSLNKRAIILVRRKEIKGDESGKKRVKAFYKS